MTTTRTHIRVVRSDGREWPTLAIAYRELIGTAQELGGSEHQRMRTAIRVQGEARDRHGFTWKSVGGTVPEQTIAWTDFTFGAELEVITTIPMYELQANLRTQGFSTWNVVRDGSLRAEAGRHGCEVVSPVLQGQAGLDALIAVMTYLEASGCRVNSSCGFHVHVGVRGMKPSRLARIAAEFIRHETMFDELVAPSRRNNQYCKSNRQNFPNALTQLRTANSVSAIGAAVNGGNSHEHYNHYRYYKLNFQSFVRHGTIEFRQHAGTVEAKKAAAWVRLVTGFCAWAASQGEASAEHGFAGFLQCAVSDAELVTYLTERRAKFARTTRAAA